MVAANIIPFELPLPLNLPTVAGGGNSVLGDGGAATNASLDGPGPLSVGPFGVALDASGNLYIADEGHNRIREVNPDGLITTVAGDGIFGYAGDGWGRHQRQFAVALRRGLRCLRQPVHR
jgi:hypothetical protein